jgi:hypothetical protein
MQKYDDWLDWFYAITGFFLIALVFVLVVALIYSAFNPPQCPEGLIYIPRLNICMEGVKPL